MYFSVSSITRRLRTWTQRRSCSGAECRPAGRAFSPASARHRELDVVFVVFSIRLDARAEHRLYCTASRIREQEASRFGSDVRWEDGDTPG